MPEEKSVIIRQLGGERFAHHGELMLHGGDCPPLQHHVVHQTQRPLVHMVCWQEESRCNVDVEGTVTVRGDEKSPLQVRMDHRFSTPHHQTHEVAPLDHTLKVSTALAKPIHHALQMRTPLQLRFCNAWHLASDYVLEVRFADSRIAAVRLTGATVATPQPCEEAPCEPVDDTPVHP
jgi:hypothetical protein